MVKCAASKELAEGRSGHLVTYMHALVIVLQPYVMSDAALLSLQAVAVSK